MPRLPCHPFSLPTRIRTLAKARQREPARAYLNDQGDLGRFLPGFDAYAGVAGRSDNAWSGSGSSVETDEDEAATRLTTDMRREHGRPGCQR